MWQNKIQLLWESIKNANPSDLICRFNDPITQNLTNRTYSDLLFDFTKLDSHFERKQNLKIALLMEKSYFSLVSILFCLFKGHTFIPIFQNSKNSKDIISLVSADLVLTIKDIESILNVTNVVSDFTPRSVEPFETAYIISTSGTTGKPKLIPISYENFSAYLDAIYPIVKTSQKFCLLQNFEISFDPYLFDLAATIFNQSYLIPLPHVQLRQISKQFETIQEEIWISLTPSQGDLIASLLPQKSWNNITHTFFLGEKLKTTLCKDWISHFPSTRIFNMYGPAEITVSIFYHEYAPKNDNGDYVPIGEIHPNHRYAINAENELLIEGPQVFKGYLDGPKTDSLFNTRDTIEVINSEIYIVGRSDFQVKINGRRFQPEEMELFLKTLGISGIIVPVTRLQRRKDKTHLVFVTQDDSVQVSALLKALQSRYDIDFVPKRVLLVNNYPLSQNGKIDRSLLQEQVHLTEPK